MTTRSHLDEIISDCAAGDAAPIHLVGRAADELSALRALVKELTAALERIKTIADAPNAYQNPSFTFGRVLTRADLALAKAKQA